MNSRRQCASHAAADGVPEAAAGTRSHTERTTCFRPGKYSGSPLRRHALRQTLNAPTASSSIQDGRAVVERMRSLVEDSLSKACHRGMSQPPLLKPRAGSTKNHSFPLSGRVTDLRAKRTRCLPDGTRRRRPEEQRFRARGRSRVALPPGAARRSAAALVSCGLPLAVRPALPAGRKVGQAAGIGVPARPSADRRRQRARRS